MKLTKHRDGTVSVRMTREQLADLQFGTHRSVRRWEEIVRDGVDGVKRSCDVDILKDYETLRDEMGAFCDELNVKY